MKHEIVIRPETSTDISAITEVTVAAFEALEISNHTEQFIIEALRVAKALTVSLVAEVDGRVVGHIAFYPVSVSDGTENWYGLGLEGVPQEVFFALSFDGDFPQGNVMFHEGFKANGPKGAAADG